MKRAALVAVACVLAAGSAFAQEVYLDDDTDDFDDGPYVEAPAIVDEEPMPEGIVVGPRVYGWSEMRPANCGTFKYWNGETCADARFEPPESD